MKHNYFLLLVILLLTSPNLYSQVVTRSLSGKKVNDFIKFHSSSTFPTIEMEKVDINKVILEDSKIKDKSLPQRYGVPISVNIGLENGKWEISTYGGHVWKLAIKSPNAMSLNLFFDKISLPEGAELYAYNADESLLFGAVTSKDSNKYKNLATTVLKGEILYLELFEPIRNKGKTELHISNVVHGFVDMANKNGPTGAALPIGNCHNNIACPEGNNIQNEADAVAMVVVPRQGRWCSGTLLNNACNNLRPNFLTAFHCLDAAVTGTTNGEIDAVETAEVNTYCFIFNFRSSTCTGTEANIVQYFSFTGGNLASSFNQTDFALITLNQIPNAVSDIKYSGWDRSGNTPASTTGVHHPGGNIMKVSLDNDAPTISPNNRFWRVVWDDGTTEGGSSGSGLFDNQNRLVGQLQGGTASCTNTTAFDQYGRISQSWLGGGSSVTRLSDHLSDDPSVTTTNTTAIPYLDIPDILCGDSPMSLASLPQIGWSLVGGSIQGAHLTSWFQSIAPNAGFSGEGFLELQLKRSGITCNDPLILRKSFSVGAPQAPQVQIYHNWDCTGWVYVADVKPNVTYNWTVTNGSQTFYRQGTSVYLPSSPSGNIYYYLEASNSCGYTWVEGEGQLYNCGGWYSAKPIDVNTGKKYDWKMQLSPNPATNDLNISLSDYNERLLNTLGELKIINMTGQVVYQTKQVLEDNMRLNIQSLNNGFYILEVHGEDFTTRQRFNVSR